jgi:hypothetical protein
LIIDHDYPSQLRRTYATIIPTTSVPEFVPRIEVPHVKERIRIGHLPPHITFLFDSVFSPHLCMIFGKAAPWELPTEDDIKNAWAVVYPKETALDFHTPLGSIVQKLVSSLTLMSK